MSLFRAPAANLQFGNSLFQDYTLYRGRTKGGTRNEMTNDRATQTQTVVSFLLQRPLNSKRPQQGCGIATSARAKGTRGKSTMVALSIHFDPRYFPNPLLSINDMVTILYINRNKRGKLEHVEYLKSSLHHTCENGRAPQQQNVYNPKCP